MKFDDMLMLCVRADIDSGKIPMLLGEPGIGKSSWLENLGRLMRTKVFTLPCNQLADKADLTGARLVPTEDKTSYMQVFYPHATITQSIDYAESHPHETPILFLDELNRTTPDVTSELLSIPTMRSIGSKSLPKNLRVVIAGNDKGNVTTLDEASVSRFVLYHVAPDTETYLSLDQNLNPYVRAVLEAHPDAIFCKQIHDGATIDGTDEIDDVFLADDDGMSQITTPRTITGVSDWLNTMSDADIRMLLSTPSSADPEAPSILQEAIEGHVGQTRFATFLLAEIANNATRNRSKSSNLVMTKPAVFDDLVNVPSTRDQLADMIAKLTDDERSASLVWALHDRADHENLIEILAPQVTMLAQNDIQALVHFNSNEDLDPANVSALLNTKSDISEKLSWML